MAVNEPRTGADQGGSTTMLDELRALLNRYGREQVSNTPDFALAEYLFGCLRLFDEATVRRARWYGGRLVPARRGSPWVPDEQENER